MLTGVRVSAGDYSASLMARLRVTGAVLAVASILAATSCSSAKTASSTPTTGPHPTYSAAQQNAYFHDVTKSVPSVSSYVNQRGTAALDALLAYGSGFCTFLQAGQDPTTALGNLQTQAQNLQAKTGFTAPQTTYETIATDALIALCPSEQSSLSPDEQAQLQQVKQTIGAT
jgi:hypothetical protein